MMLNIIKSFLNNEYFWIGNKEKRFALFTQPLPWLKRQQNNTLCTLNFEKLVQKDTKIGF